MQVQLFYDIQEDRLKLIVSGEAEAQAWWVTRLGVRILAEALTARLAETPPPNALGGHDQDEASQPVPIVSSPILAVAHEHLLTAVRHGRQETGQHLLVLVGKDQEEQGVQCDDEALRALLELLRQQLEQTDWGLMLRWPDARHDFDVPVGTLQ